jgi:hypothetical protein
MWEKLGADGMAKANWVGERVEAPGEERVRTGREERTTPNIVLSMWFWVVWWSEFCRQCG